MKTDLQNKSDQGRETSPQYHKIMKTKLTKKEVETLYRLREKIDAIRAKVDPDDEMNLQIEGNGTIGGQLSVASASLDTILQEYL